MADPLKTSPLLTCYHVKFGRSASKGVCINRREPPKLGSTGAHPLGWEAWLNPRNTPLSTCCLAKRGRSALKGIGINTAKSQKLGSIGAPPPWDGARPIPYKEAPSHMCYHVKYGPPASKGVCINRREPPKLGSAGGKLCPLVVVAWLTPGNSPLPTLSC